MKLDRRNHLKYPADNNSSFMTDSLFTFSLIKYRISYHSFEYSQKQWIKSHIQCMNEWNDCLTITYECEYFV